VHLMYTTTEERRALQPVTSLASCDHSRGRVVKEALKILLEASK
jgi:hypothetical protein